MIGPKNFMKLLAMSRMSLNGRGKKQKSYFIASGPYNEKPLGLVTKYHARSEKSLKSRCYYGIFRSLGNTA